MAFHLAMPLSAGITASKRVVPKIWNSWSGRNEGTLKPAPVSNGFSIYGRDIRSKRRRRRTCAGIKRPCGVLAAAADSARPATGSEEASGVSSGTFPGAGETEERLVTSSTFTQRVEAAAAALRSGSALKQRRNPATTSVDTHVASAPTLPSSAPRVPSPGPRRRESRADRRQESEGAGVGTNDSLLSTTENNDQMAASQNRLFEQMVTLRTRLNERLAASNKFAKFLESTLQTRDKDIKHANERLVAAMLEIDSLQHIAQDAVDAAEDESQTREHIAARLNTLTKRLDLMQAALKRDVKDIDAACIKTVPIRWVGMASDIRIMGSFDHWTKGIAMSPEFIEGGNNVFVADLNLIPGTYEIKFVVDGIWQTAPQWATSGEGLDANNLLVVE